MFKNADVRQMNLKNINMPWKKYIWKPLFYVSTRTSYNFGLSYAANWKFIVLFFQIFTK